MQWCMVPVRVRTYAQGVGAEPFSSSVSVTFTLDMASGVLQLSSVSESHSSLYEESLKHPEQFWGDLAGRRLRWIKKFDQVMDCDMRSGQFKWFLGGVWSSTYRVSLLWS